MKFKDKEGKTRYRLPCGYCQKTIEYSHGEGNKLTDCPHCKTSSKWILKPRTEVLLFELQDKYFSTLDFVKWEKFTQEIIKKDEDEIDQNIIDDYLHQRDEKTLYEMYMLVQRYSESLIKKYLKNKGFTIPRDILNEHIQNVAFLWFENYTRKFKYRIDDSWAGFLNTKIIQSFYSKNQKNLDMTDSLDKVITNSSTKDTELMDMSDQFHFKPLFGDIDKYDPHKNSYDIIDELKKVIYKILNTIDQEKTKKSRRRTILALTAFYLFISKQDKKLAQFYGLYGKGVKEDNEQIKRQIRNYLRKVQEDENNVREKYDTH
jgi:hypothetical protein